MWKVKYAPYLSPKEAKFLFDNYKQTYKDVEIFYDHWAIIKRKKNFWHIYCEPVETDDVQHYKFICAFSVCIRENFPCKINLIIHTNSEESKRILLDTISSWLRYGKFGNLYFMEASGAVSWILRNRYNLKPILDQDIIEYLTKQKVEMNPNFDNSKNSNVFRFINSNRKSTEWKSLFFKKVILSKHY